ncbi:MAG: FixH family protein [Pseudomonadota bacterium]
MTTAPFTGRKFFFIVASAFGVIITVNFTMAYMAVSTFPGVEARNSYVASQTFDAERKAQLALGWDVGARIEGEMLILTILDSEGAPVEVATLEAIFGRATHVNDDQVPAFTFENGAYVAPVEAGPGNWNLRFVATDGEGGKFRQRISLYQRPAS